MPQITLPDDIIPGNLAPMFRADGSPRLGPDGRQVVDSYTHAAAANWVALTNNGFFTPEKLVQLIDRSPEAGTPKLIALKEYLQQRGPDFELPELFGQGALLKPLTELLSSSQVIGAARPFDLNVWQPVEAALVADVSRPGQKLMEKHVFLATRGPHRKDTPGISTFPGGFTKIIDGHPETAAEVVRREIIEELGLEFAPGELQSLGIATHNGSPSILPVRTGSGIILAGIIPEFMPAYSAVSSGPFFRLQERIQFNYESVGLLALNVRNIVDLRHEGRTTACFYPSQADFARPLTENTISLGEISRRIEKAPPVDANHRGQTGTCGATHWLSVNASDISERVLAVATWALIAAGTSMPFDVVAATDEYIRSHMYETGSVQAAFGVRREPVGNPTPSP